MNRFQRTMHAAWESTNFVLIAVFRESSIRNYKKSSALHFTPRFIGFHVFRNHASLLAFSGFYSV